MKTNTILRKGFAFALITLVSLNSLASECYSDWFTNQNKYIAKSSTSRVQQHQYDQWEDRIWRGPIFQCNSSSGGGDCTYRWDQTNYKEYSWGVGVSVDLKGIPLIGSVIGALTPSSSYTSTKGWSQTFAWSQIVKPGYYARPVQIVRRAWTTGIFKGGYEIVPGSNCNGGEGSWYNWNSNATFGGWGAQLEKSRYAKYDIWQ